MRTILLLAALSALPWTPPAVAGGMEPPSHRMVIAHADLDLTSRSGVARLDERIRVAVREACGAASDADLEGKIQVRVCRVALKRRVSVLRDQAIAAASRPVPEALAASREN